MANLAGFIPQPGPGAVYGGNWSQDYSDVMNTLVEAQRAQQQNQFAHSPFGGSFFNRFGGPLPPGLAGGAAQAPQQPPVDMAALQGALAQAIGSTPGTSITSPPFGDTIVNQATGSLQSQPWYDEFMAVAQAGGNTPVVKGNHMPLQQHQQQALDAGIQDRRQQRLGGTLPMADRRANVRNNAIAESEQRSVRMGDMSENQQYFNELSRLQGDLGGQQGGGDLMNGVMFGPKAMADMAAVKQRQQEVMAKLGFAASDPGLLAASIASGNPMSLQQIQQMRTPPQVADQLFQQAAGNWEVFKNLANANNISAEQTLNEWQKRTGQKMGGVQAPSIFDPLIGAGTQRGWDWNPYD